MRARVYMTLKPSCSIRRAAWSPMRFTLGYQDVKDVRQGKFFEVELDGGGRAAKARVTEMADQLLANPVIESYRVEVLGVGHEVRRRCVSRLELRLRRLLRRVAVSANEAALVWHKDTDLRAPTL